MSRPFREESRTLVPILSAQVLAREDEWYMYYYALPLLIVLTVLIVLFYVNCINCIIIINCTNCIISWGGASPLPRHHPRFILQCNVELFSCTTIFHTSPSFICTNCFLAIKHSTLLAHWHLMVKSPQLYEVGPSHRRRIIDMMQNQWKNLTKKKTAEMTDKYIRDTRTHYTDNMQYLCF